MNTELLALEAAPTDPERLKAVFRVAHTLKGAARAANVPLIEETCHRLKSLLAQARDRKTTLTPRHFQSLFAAAAPLGGAGARLKQGTSLAGSPLAQWAEPLAAGRDAEATPVPAEEAPQATPPQTG